MRWQTGRQSSNVEDRRGVGRKGIALGGGGLLLLLLLAVIFKQDPTALLQQVQLQTNAPDSRGTDVTSPEQEELKQFMGAVLADTEDVWHSLFQEMGETYREPTLVLFTGNVTSACGQASAAVGPFYCGADHKVYLDLSFFDELNRRFGAPGDFAQAYVIAHEVGHHVQNQLGIMDRVNRLRTQMSETEYNELSVRLELQADFFAGVWAHHAQKMRQVLEPGDLEEALRAATAIGDDTLQKQTQGYVVPDSFTHGTSEQRLKWFKRGFESGNMSDGDTFSAADL